MVDYDDTLSDAGYRVVRRFGAGIPDGCSVPLSLKIQEEKESNSQQPQRKLSVHQQIQEEIVRRSHGAWSRRSIIAPWIYQEADLFQSEIIQKAKHEHERKWYKADRQKRVKEEIARIKRFMNAAYAYDTRITKFKVTEEKRKKKNKFGF